MAGHLRENARVLSSLTLAGRIKQFMQKVGSRLAMLAWSRPKQCSDHDHPPLASLFHGQTDVAHWGCHFLFTLCFLSCTRTKKNNVNACETKSGIMHSGTLHPHTFSMLTRKLEVDCGGVPVTGTHATFLSFLFYYTCG